MFLHSSVFGGFPYELTRGMRVEFKVMAGDRGRKAPGAASASALSGPLAPVIPDPGEEPMCDVLSAAEFSRELTELLIGAVPDLTGRQIVRIRQGVAGLANRHGWSDG